jgi:hypothetical protein
MTPSPYPRRGAVAAALGAATLALATSPAALSRPAPITAIQVRAQLTLAGHDPALAARLLRRAHTTTGGARAAIAGAAVLRPGCHTATIRDRHTIGWLGITFGWQEVDLHGFCWNGRAITWAGGASYRRYSAFPYCWTNTNAWYGWLAYPTWQQAWAYGQLGGNTGFGCIGLQSDQPKITIANGGGIWRT